MGTGGNKVPTRRPTKPAAGPTGGNKVPTRRPTKPAGPTGGNNQSTRRTRPNGGNTKPAGPTGGNKMPTRRTGGNTNPAGRTGGKKTQTGNQWRLTGVGGLLDPRIHRSPAMRTKISAMFGKNSGKSQIGYHPRR